MRNDATDLHVFIVICDGHFFFFFYIYMYINSSQDSCHHLIYFIYLFLFIDLYVFIPLSKHLIQKLVLRSWQYPCTCFFLKQLCKSRSTAKRPFGKLQTSTQFNLILNFWNGRNYYPQDYFENTIGSLWKISPFSMKWCSCPDVVRLYINFNLFIFILILL